VTGTGQDHPRWFKSSRSGGGDCVEVAFVGEEVWVRDSKNPEGGQLILSREAWLHFLSDLPERQSGDRA
jgi:hypothetical protein